MLHPPTRMLAVVLLIFCSSPVTSQTGTGPIVLDDFASVAGWTAHPADGVELEIAADSVDDRSAMRLEFDFVRGGGYAVARREIDLQLPDNYAFSFRVRGLAAPNHMEFKLIDASGENVWWSVRRNMEFTEQWQTIRIKRRHLQFAWGPLGGGEIHHVAAIELAITAGSGGRGTLWIDDLELKPLRPPSAVPQQPRVFASSESERGSATAVLDGDSTTAWWSQPGDEHPWLALDFRELQEYGGLIIDWVPGQHARDYVIESSEDGQTWSSLVSIVNGNGKRDYIDLHEGESLFLRLRQVGARGLQPVAIQQVTVQDLAWSASREAFFQAIAQDARRGLFPRAFSAEQSYWTVVGIDGDRRELLFNEDGMIETGKASFSIEPFLRVENELITWSDVVTEQSLVAGSLPMPRVTWQGQGMKLEISPFAVGKPESSSVIVSYRLSNHAGRRMRVALFLALRPFQVNPPTQFLNTRGGTAPLGRLDLRQRIIRANGQRAVVALTPPMRVGASTFDAGDIVRDYLHEGELPPMAEVHDDKNAASGALAYDFDLEPAAVREVHVWIPLFDGVKVPTVTDAVEVSRWVAAQFESCRRDWQERTARVTIQLPPAGQDLLETLRSQLSYILVNRAGPAIQPGTRAYARAWIRDGALTSSALLRLGHPEPVKAFIEWFAPHQYSNGKVPCCVDERGADPVPEHDSAGEFIFLIAESFRYTGDRELLERMWPRVTKAVGYLDSLRMERRTEEYKQRSGGAFYGLLPPSISHEGYSAKPMHSYWDDFFALRGFMDAAWLAQVMGRAAEHARLAAIRDEFRLDLVASLEACMRHHGIDHLPGCADLGDFDPTSTTIALTPVGAASLLPRVALQRTFEKYYDFFRERRARGDWEVYTPYEIRNVGAFVRLGWRERAHELLEFFLADRRPSAWAQWAEVVGRDERRPRFIGDMPHSWVGSDFVRAVLDMLVYEREERGEIVLGAGVPIEWLEEEPGVVIRGLPTPHGLLSYTMRRVDDAVVVRIEEGLRLPPGGIVVRAPFPGTAGTVTINGVSVTPRGDGEVVVRELPALVLLQR